MNWLAASQESQRRLLHILNEQNEIYLRMKRAGLPIVPINVVKQVPSGNAAFFSWDWVQGAKGITYDIRFFDAKHMTIRPWNREVKFRHPGSTVHHETGHLAHWLAMNNKKLGVLPEDYSKLDSANTGPGLFYKYSANPVTNERWQNGEGWFQLKNKRKTAIFKNEEERAWTLTMISDHLSYYATTNPLEFIAEFWGATQGKKRAIVGWPKELYQLYKKVGGPPLL
jgi:hypothetical protein